MTRGYFGKTEANVGTLWRSAYQLGAAGIFTIWRRYPQQTSDTTKAWRHLPMREFATFDDFLAAQPYSCPIIGVEMGGKPLPSFSHPERAIYLLGAEDHGIPKEVLAKCQHVLSLPSVRSESYNVAVAGSLVMYDRMVRT